VENFSRIAGNLVKMDHHLVKILRFSCNGSGVGGGSGCARRNSSALTITLPRYVLFVLVGLLCSPFLHSSYGFNIDVPSAITHRGPSGSMFGFAVAQHKDSNISWYECYYHY
jgi:hypothetical protein